MRRPRLLLPLLCGFAVACGSITSPDDDDDDDDDVVGDVDAATSSGTDAAPGPDGLVSVPDAAAPDARPVRTHCGETSCEYATEICVYRSAGGPSTAPRCEPVPEDCKDNRTCECVADKLCTDIASECIDDDAENTVRCECTFCG